MKHILSFSKISKQYNDLFALKDVSFDIPNNSIYGILGPNGSGKSTLMRVLSNLILYYSGLIKFNNQIIDPKSNTYITSFGFLIENPSFYEFLSARHNLQILSRISGVPYLKIDKALELVGLLDRSNDKVKTYSYGMKQRLGLAQALLHDPKILVLDEPNNGLDPKGIEDMSNIINSLHSLGKTIILSTHILSEIESLCTHFTILKKGKNIVSKSMKEIINNSSQYTIIVNDCEMAKTLLSNSSQIKIISINENKIILTSKESLTIDKINTLLKNKIILEQFYKNSGLIELFND